MKKDRQRIIYEVALGGVAAGIATLLVSLSVVVKYGTIGFFVAACVAIMIPLSQKYYFSSVVAYIASSLISFAITGDFFAVAGYVVYFAPMAILSGIFIEKHVKWFISLPVKAVYINLALAFLYFVAGNIMVSEEIIGKIPYYAIAIVGTVVLIAVDFLLGYVYLYVKNRTEKVLRKRQNKTEVVDDNPFEDMDDETDDVFDDENIFDGENEQNSDKDDKSGENKSSGLGDDKSIEEKTDAEKSPFDE